MSARRPLGVMLQELASGSLDALEAAPHLEVLSVFLSLPVEIALKQMTGGVELLGDLPRLLTRTAFDAEPARLEVLWEKRPLP